MSREMKVFILFCAAIIVFGTTEIIAQEKEPGNNTAPLALGSSVATMAGILGLILREVKKNKDFKAKNGSINRIENKIDTLVSGQVEVKTEISNIKNNCKAVSSALTKQISDNQKNIFILAKNGKK